MARKKPRRLTQEEKEELIRRSRQGGNNPAGGRPVETDPDRLFANRRKDKKDDGDEGEQIPLDMLKTKDKEQHRRGIRAAAKAGRQRMWDELGIGGTAPMPKYTGSDPEGIAANKRIHRTTLKSSKDFDARTKELADQRVKEYYKTLRDAGLGKKLAQRQTMRQVNQHDLRATGSTEKGRERTMHRIDDMGKIIPFTQALQKAFGLQKRKPQATGTTGRSVRQAEGGSSTRSPRGVEEQRPRYKNIDRTTVRRKQAHQTENPRSATLLPPGVEEVDEGDYTATYTDGGKRMTRRTNVLSEEADRWEPSKYAKDKKGTWRMENMQKAIISLQKFLDNDCGCDE